MLFILKDMNRDSICLFLTSGKCRMPLTTYMHSILIYLMGMQTTAFKIFKPGAEKPVKIPRFPSKLLIVIDRHIMELHLKLFKVTAFLTKKYKCSIIKGPMKLYFS